MPIYGDTGRLVRLVKQDIKHLEYLLTVPKPEEWEARIKHRTQTIGHLHELGDRLYQDNLEDTP